MHNLSHTYTHASAACMLLISAIGLYGHWVLHQLVSVVVTSTLFTCITTVVLFVAKHIATMHIVDLSEGSNFDEVPRPWASIDTRCHTCSSFSLRKVKSGHFSR